VASGNQHWATLDLDGDGLVELVVTRDCLDPAVGETRWNVHKAVCL
jgi:hypothetical protein